MAGENEPTKYSIKEIEFMVTEVYNWYQRVYKFKFNGEEPTMEHLMARIYPLVKDYEYEKEEEKRTGKKLGKSVHRTSYFNNIITIVNTVILLILLLWDKIFGG